MRKKVLFLALGITCLQSSIVFAQYTRRFPPAPALADDRGAALYENDPSTYKSEETYGVEWTHVAMETVAWKKKVWRTIDVEKGQNKIMDNAVPFDRILAGAVISGATKAYSVEDDRFTKPMDMVAFKKILVTAQQSGKITSYRLKESWLYDAKTHHLYGRLTGIAPLQDGKPLFWIYYPELRPLLRTHAVTAPAGVKADNLDQWFEGHYYAAPIDQVKSSDRPKLASEKKASSRRVVPVSGTLPSQGQAVDR